MPTASGPLSRHGGVLFAECLPLLDVSKALGGASLGFRPFPLASFNWVKGEPTRYRSSRYAGGASVPECGSTLTMHEEILSDRVLVTVGKPR